MNMVELPCASSTIKFDNVIFEILKHARVYNILQSENDGVYIYIWLVSGHTKTEHTSVYDINYNTLLGDIVGINCVNLVDNQKYAPIRLLEKYN